MSYPQETRKDLAARHGGGSTDEFSSLIFDANAHILKSAAHLENDDRELASRYIRSIKNLDEVVRQSQSEEAVEEWEISAVMPPSVREEVLEITRAEKEMEALRSQLVAKVRKAQLEI